MADTDPLFNLNQYPRGTIIVMYGPDGISVECNEPDKKKAVDLIARVVAVCGRFSMDVMADVDSEKAKEAARDYIVGALRAGFDMDFDRNMLLRDIPRGGGDSTGEGEV